MRRILRNAAAEMSTQSGIQYARFNKVNGVIARLLVVLENDRPSHCSGPLESYKSHKRTIVKSTIPRPFK